MKYEMISTDRQRNYNLDLIRIIACFAVVGLHVCGKDISVVNTVWYYLCGFAVPAFFMASGYILMQRKNIGIEYVAKKYQQIFKVIFLWGTLASMIVLIKGMICAEDWELIIWNIIKQMMGGVIQKGAFSQFWFLGALMLVYTMLPLLIALSRKKQVVVWLFFLIVGEMLQIISIHSEFPIQREVIQTFRIWTWIQYFLLGGFMYVVNRYLHKISTVIHMLLLIVWTVGLMSYQFYMGSYVINSEIGMVQYAEFFYDSIFEIIWLILLFSLVLKLRFSIVYNDLIEKISPSVMGIYIIHILVLRVIKHFVKAHEFGGSVILYIMVLSVSFFVVKIMWRFECSRNFVKL